jgi:hypothetical protein
MMKTLFNAFARDQRGASMVEFAMLVPVLLLVFLGTNTAFDLFRNAQNVEKATFTVGDMLSRQEVVNAARLNEMLELDQFGRQDRWPHGGALDQDCRPERADNPATRLGPARYCRRGYCHSDRELRAAPGHVRRLWLQRNGVHHDCGASAALCRRHSLPIGSGAGDQRQGFFEERLARGCHDIATACRLGTIPAGNGAAGFANDRHERCDIIGIEIGLDDEIGMAGREQGIAVAIHAEALEPGGAFNRLPFGGELGRIEKLWGRGEDAGVGEAFGVAAAKVSPTKGWLMSPASATPSTAKPISVPQTGAPEMKARVPSMGSMIQL